MKSKLLFGSVLVVLGGMVVPPVCVTTWAAEPSTDSSTGRLPSDLARASSGTQLQVREPNKAAATESASAQSLIGEDARQTYSLAAGKTSMILSLSKIEAVNHFDFVNAGAEGKVTVSVSSAKLPFDSADWRVVASAQSFEGRQLIPCDLGSVDARYVKIDFDTRTAGNISGFNLFGMTALRAPAMTKGIFHVNVRTAATSNVEASFNYDPADPAPKVVADLGVASEVKRITCAYEAPNGHLDLYLVDNTTGQGEPLKVGLNYVGEPTLQPVSNDGAAKSESNVLAGHAAIYSVQTDEKAPGKVSADLKGLTGRYLVAAFTPDVVQRGDTKDFKNVRSDAKDKDGKQAPVFPAFTNAPAGFGNAPNNVNPPLLPPPIVINAGSP